MSEWDFDERTNDQQGKRKTLQTGGWDVLLTLVALVSVAVVSFLVAWATRDVASRPFWMLGLCFAAPVAALMLSVFLKEKASSAMTPSTSRSAQLVLVLCSILAAAVVGCFCQVTNEKADTFEEVVTGEGWSDVLIILDKSGSMSWTPKAAEALINGASYNEAMKYETPGTESLDEMATSAVIDLIGKMADETKVGMIIDVGWAENNSPQDTVPLEKRKLPILPLTPAHRQDLTSLAHFKLMNTGNFPRAFDAAYEMVEAYDGEKGEISIVILSDGQDITEEFRADDYADKFLEKGVKVNYLYVVSDYSAQVMLLSQMTGGKSIFVNDRQELFDQMKTMVMVPIITIVYKDALRDIGESDRAKIVTGILLLLLGLLIGISLRIMLSVQGQKRFQVILSPLMAACAFLILAYGEGFLPVPWIREGVAFSLLGIVLMKKNNPAGYSSGGSPERKVRPAAGKAQEAAASADEW